MVILETKGCSLGWLGSAWPRVEEEVREGAVDWCSAGWELVFLEVPSGSDPTDPG